jgi:hypothetical protein
VHKINQISYSLSLRAWVSTQLFYTAKTMGCHSSKLPLLLERPALSGVEGVGERGFNT